MTPHDCATQGHRWEIDVACDCGQCSLVSLDESLESFLRRALTDAVQERARLAWMDAIVPFRAPDALDEHRDNDAARNTAMRDVLITAILTAARETRHD